MKLQLSKAEKEAAKRARDLAWFEREMAPAKLEASWREREGGKSFIGPVAPHMWLWQKRGEPGFPFHWDGGPLPGTINYVAQLQLPMEAA